MRTIRQPPTPRDRSDHLAVVTQLPINVLLDDNGTPSDVLNALILTALTTGVQPFVRTTRKALG